MTEYSGFGLSNHPITDHDERPRGIFTQNNRVFLINNGNPPSDRAEYKQHEKIRQRLLDGIIDFQLAHRHLEEWNWNKFLDLDTTEERELRNSMAAAIALFYEIHQAKGWNFSNTLYDGIDDAYTTGYSKRTMPHKFVENVIFEVDAKERDSHGMDVERISQKLAENAELTDEEAHFAVKQGWFDILDEHYSREKQQDRRREKRREENIKKLAHGDFEKPEKDG
jgi:hypothetical protein